MTRYGATRKINSSLTSLALIGFFCYEVSQLDNFLKENQTNIQIVFASRLSRSGDFYFHRREKKSQKNFIFYFYFLKQMPSRLGWRSSFLFCVMVCWNIWPYGFLFMTNPHHTNNSFPFPVSNFPYCFFVCFSLMWFVGGEFKPAGKKQISAGLGESFTIGRRGCA
jgi:hypothetical protein